MKKGVSCLVILAILFFRPSVVFAQPATSNNYSVEESSFSSGSGTGSSASFSAQGSAGDNAIGFAYSAGYAAYAGPISPNEEYLELFVAATTIDLDTPSSDPGVLSTTETATGSATFYVRAYLNASYVVNTMSAPLTSENGDTINPLTSAAASSIGVEQFGINLVDNASPNLGSDPSLQPDSNFANGEAASGYDTADQFRYNQGDVIAQNGGNPAWGQTNYTISYIANISGVTEAGSYSMQHILVATPTF